MAKEPKCKITGITDNRGNSFIVHKLMSTKFPIPVLLMELTEQLREQGLDLNLEWQRRDLNKEADALTNEDFRGFDVPPGSLQWLILPEFMESSTRLFEEMQAEKKRNPGGSKAPWPKAKALWLGGQVSTRQAPFPGSPGSPDCVRTRLPPPKLKWGPTKGNGFLLWDGLQGNVHRCIASVIMLAL